MDIKRRVFNSTEGGAKIKGTIQLSLKEYIEKYCQEPIDKSKIKPLLSYADNGDELVEKVIPLLEQDIKNLDDIIINARKGKAISHGLKVLMSRDNYKRLLTKKKEKLFEKLNKKASREIDNKITISQIFFSMAIKKLRKSKLKTILIMSSKNFDFSEAAHVASVKNPLVNVAIYGASRRIQGRELKGDQTVVSFLKDRKNAIMRTERNMIILDAAYTAAKSLKKSYEKTFKLLKEYDETKDDTLLRPLIDEEINLDDAESYFEQGNWAHPILDAKKIIDEFNNPNVEKICFKTFEVRKAEIIYDKALKMRQEAIDKAKESEKEHHDKMTKLVKYNELIEQAKEKGSKEKDFDSALELMRKAVKLMPDNMEARWGLATALHHSNNIKESLEHYEKLTNDFPENNLFKFEYGQVLIRGNRIQDGLKVIGEVMKKTSEYDHFLARVGEIYQESNMFKEALIAYSSYLKKFPYDYKIWNKKGDCLIQLSKEQQAEKAYAKAKEINPKN